MRFTHTRSREETREMSRLESAIYAELLEDHRREQAERKAKAAPAA